MVATSWYGHFDSACFTFFAGPHYNDTFIWTCAFSAIFLSILISLQCQKGKDHRYETESIVILNSLFHIYRWNHSVMLISLENISILWMVWKMSTFYSAILYILDIGPVSLTVKDFIKFSFTLFFFLVNSWSFAVFR